MCENDKFKSTALCDNIQINDIFERKNENNGCIGQVRNSGRLSTRTALEASEKKV